MSDNKEATPKKYKPKPAYATWWFWTIIILIIAIISTSSKNNNTTQVETQPQDDAQTNEQIVQDSEAVDSTYIDALRKCTVMEAYDIVTTGIGHKTNNPYDDAKNTCEQWYTQWGESDFYDAVRIDWEDKKDQLLEEKPLTDHLESLGW